MTDELQHRNDEVASYAANIARFEHLLAKIRALPGDDPQHAELQAWADEHLVGRLAAERLQWRIASLTRDTITEMMEATHVPCAG